MPKNPRNRNFWTVKEVADYLEVSPLSVYRMIGKNRDPDIEPPPHRRITKGCIKFPIKKFLAWANPDEDKSCSA